MKNLTIVTALSILAAASPLAALTCSENTTVGTFDVSYEGAVYDGFSTEITYCITGHSGTQGLSHWVGSLDPSCIAEEDLLACDSSEPYPCFYQEDDPTTGLTGIKWDDTQVEGGETECFSYALDGDWTRLIGDTTIGLKAGPNSYYGDICGPTCVRCNASLDVITPTDAQAAMAKARGEAKSGNNSHLLSVFVIHNGSNTVKSPILFKIFDSTGSMVHRWVEAPPVTFTPGHKYRYLGPIPRLNHDLEPGQYKLIMKIKGMNGWIRKVQRFTVQ